MKSLSMRLLRALLDGAIDYAGLFPPARLSLADAVSAYASYLAHPARPYLGRFVLPVSKLPDFARIVEKRARFGDEPWRISAVMEEPGQHTANDLLAWNREVSGTAFVDSVEGKSARRGDTAWLAEFAAAGFHTYVEFVPGDLAPALLDSLASQGLRAKFRTGGVTPEAFPSPSLLLECLRAARVAHVPFKLTAGLHHPLGGEFPLTYEPGSPCHRMYGFLDVALASLLVWADMPDSEALTALSGGGIRWVTGDAALTVAGREFGLVAIRQLRSEFFQSFGSCSFEEPVGELERLCAP